MSEDSVVSKARKYNSNFAILGVVILLGSGLLFGFTRSATESVCSGVEVSLSAELEEPFLDKETILQIVDDAGSLVGSPTQKIDLAAIENRLLETGFVESVTASFDALDVLQVEVRLKHPIARLLDVGGRSCYVDDRGHLFPVARGVTARCMIITGSFSLPEHPVADSLGQLASFFPVVQAIISDDFFRQQVSEMVVSKSNDITLFPEVGDTEVLFGKPVRIEEKLSALRTFYAEVLKRKGWDYYSSISLAFAGQVVARRSGQVLPED